MTISPCHLLEFHVEHPLFRAGQSNTIEAVLTNECTGNMIDVYLAFEAGGMFFFWPDWSQTPSCKTMFVSSGQTLEIQVLQATWPDLPVYGQTVTFWGVALDNGTGSVVSSIATVDLIY